MIGILIVSHKDFGVACLNLVEHVFEGCSLEHVRFLSIGGEDDIELMKMRARKLRDEIDFGFGVIMLNDLLGASPFNICKHMIDAQTVLLTGANAPMVIRAVHYGKKSTNLQKLFEDTKKAAYDGIVGLTINNLDQYD